MNLTAQQLMAIGYTLVDDPCNPGRTTWVKSRNAPQTHAKAPQSDSMVVGATKPPKRIRQSTKPLLNKLEEEFAGVLKYRFPTGYVCAQCLRFKLGNGICYKPDFVAWPAGFDSQDPRMRAFEVKGPHAFRGGFENLKVAASLYCAIKWTLVWKEDGQWKEQTVLP